MDELTRGTATLEQWGAWWPPHGQQRRTGISGRRHGCIAARGIRRAPQMMSTSFGTSAVPRTPMCRIALRARAHTPIGRTRGGDESHPADQCARLGCGDECWRATRLCSCRRAPPPGLPHDSWQCVGRPVQPTPLVLVGVHEAGMRVGLAAMWGRCELPARRRSLAAAPRMCAHMQVCVCACVCARCNVVMTQARAARQGWWHDCVAGAWQPGLRAIAGTL